MKDLKTYSSKILLFGEYTILQGSEGLAIPLPDYFGQWQVNPLSRPNERSLLDMVTYLDQQDFSFQININQFREDLNNGWYFESTIPIGYGVGSSGALTAAIYDKYVIDKKTDLLDLKKELGQIESFFHGESSGIDPLICFLNQPILMKSKTDLKILEQIPDFQSSFSLIDTGISRSTEPLVNLFLEKSKDLNFQQRIEAELVPTVNDAIDAFLTQKQNLLFEHLHEISFFQYKYFNEMIPKDFQQLWLDGLASDEFKLKLCGAGGGGFIIKLKKQVS